MHHSFPASLRESIHCSFILGVGDQWLVTSGDQIGFFKHRSAADFDSQSNMFKERFENNNEPAYTSLIQGFTSQLW